MTKTAYEKQTTRLRELKCPQHGSSFEISGTPGHYVFTCPDDSCEIGGSAEHETGPISLSPRFQYLIDPDIGQLPQQTYNQERGLRAADIVSIAMSKIAFVHRVETGSDIGVDFICELREEGRPTGKMFNVQCKVLPTSFDPAEDSFSLPIKVSTARYWLEQTPPTMLVVADDDNGHLYWQDPVEFLTKKTGDWRKQGDVSIPILKATEFSCFDMPPQAFIDKVRQGISRIGNSLRERLYTVERIIDNEVKTGVNRKSRDVGYLLLEPGSPASEAFAAISSITAFQGEIFGKILLMIADMSGAVAKLHEDSFRKLHHYTHRAVGRFEDDPDFKEERKILDNAAAFAAGGKAFSNPAQLSEAINILNALEELHRDSLSRETEAELYYQEQQADYALRYTNFD